MKPPFLKIESMQSHLMRPVDASTLGTFRIVFGAALVWAMAKFFVFDKIRPKYIDKDFLFTYPFFDWVTPLPGFGMYIVFAVVGVSAMLISIGLYYRMASVTFLLGYTYIFLLEQAEFNNHYYMICLLAFLFCITHADRWMAVDNRWEWRSKQKAETNTIPYWNLFIFKAQVFIVYFYGGISKINFDWLKGEPIRGWVQNWVENDPEAPRFLGSELFVFFICYGGLIFDLVIGFLLWWRKTRPLAIVLLLIFHLMNHWMFTIGVFPFLMLGATALFLEPETPRKFIQTIFKGQKKDMGVGVERKAQASGLVTAFVAIYLALQIVIPLRHWLYPGNVAWTDEGRLFAWRMKLQTKEDCAINFMAANPETGETWPIYPEGNLSYRQFKIMCGEARKIVLYAQYLGKRLQREGEVNNPIITVISKVSLNFRPHQALIDPDVDLLKVKLSPFRHSEWIKPLKE
jgi:vitamin K-dependent gamma-carboxylase